MLEIVLFIVVALGPAIILHELAHGLMAYAFGDPTAKDHGRLTLNPISHIDPVGSIIVPGILFLAYYIGMTKSLMLFGWAKPVPVNFRNLRNRRLGMASVALAGPLTNIALAFIFSRLYTWPSLEAASHTFAWAVMLNLTLAVFNMIPIPPLDGSRVVTSVLPMQLAYYYNRLEPFGIIIVILLLNVGLMGYLYPVIQQVGYWIGVQI
ncbi:MAG: site-2 protease family protein [Candidatus Omnitrophica bacterium]|nr:site-2 protease family protein [Candidatus Omnitrophota bacterium]MDE2222640.1 site-2 protease family protein [Candidatus Omnitrophota bacterium]